MSSLNVCVVALCLVLIAVVESHVIKAKDFKIPPEGMTLEVNVHDADEVVATMKIEIDGLHKKARLSVSDSKMPDPGFVSALESQNAIGAWVCPLGTVKIGGNCLPYEDD